MTYPNHVGIILDGNRRYAKKHNKPTFYGHKKGAEALKKTLQACKEFGIKELSVFAFSSENFKRSKEEVDYLMRLIESGLREIIGTLEDTKDKLKVRVIGQKNLLPDSLRKYTDSVEERTKNNSDYIFNICLAYGGRSEIVDACKTIFEKVNSGKMKTEDISEETLSECMYMRDQPDLLIRTSEQRLSGFLTWQSVYSEIIFLPDVLWPEFDKTTFKHCLEEYANRKRRFGA